jgi:hypothetical protein
VINNEDTGPKTVNFTWQGHRGEVNADATLSEEECDVADWGTYTYDVDVIETDATGNFVDWFSYKWPSCLSIGSHTIEAVDNVDGSGSTLNYTYSVNDIANEDSTGYYPNAEDPSELKVVVLDDELEEKRTIDLDWQNYGQTYGGTADSCSEKAEDFYCFRTVYIGQDNCWIADRRDHLKTNMLASNKMLPFEVSTWPAWFEAQVTEIAVAMKNANWNHIDAGYNANDKGAFGKEFSKRIFQRLHGNSGIYCNIFVDPNTKIIQKIDPNYTSNTLIEIDAIKCKDGYVPTVGSRLEETKIEAAFEVKSSVGGTVYRAQRARYQLVLPNTQRFRVAPGYRYNFPTFAVDDNVKYSNKMKIFSYVVGGLSAANSLWKFYKAISDDDSTASEWNELKICISEVKQNPEDTNCRIGLHVAIMSLLQKYIDNNEITLAANYIGLVNLAQNW